MHARSRGRVSGSRLTEVVGGWWLEVGRLRYEVPTVVCGALAEGLAFGPSEAGYHKAQNALGLL